MDNYVYILGKKIYINLTNDCSNNCDFCIRKSRDDMAGYALWLQNTPSAEDVIEQLPSNLDEYDEEVVFCGFGEPTCNMPALADVAEFLHCKNKTTRINTNGQGNLINGKDIVGDIVDTCDVVNVSLNASSKEKYNAVCHSRFGENAFDELLNFALSVKTQGGKVVFSVVDSIGESEIALCQKLADKYKIPLRVRTKI